MSLNKGTLGKKVVNTHWNAKQSYVMGHPKMAILPIIVGRRDYVLLSDSFISNSKNSNFLIFRQKIPTS